MTTPLSCTAFDLTQRIGSGPYLRVALMLKAYGQAHPDASVLVFDDATGQQIDFDRCAPTRRQPALVAHDHRSRRLVGDTQRPLSGFSRVLKANHDVRSDGILLR
jgi:hypothetical protein